MRVNKAIVESYGEKSCELDFSQGNLRLIYGQNEAGKSTLLNFIRDVLFGLSDEKGRNALFGEPVVGGRIEFTLRDGRYGVVSQKWSRLEKSTQDRFSASIRNPRTGLDDELDRDAFQELLGGADRNLFAQYFGFSHQELVDGSALLDKTSLNRLIYGMILGSPERLEAAQKATAERCKSLFLLRGKNQTINSALKSLKDAKEALKSVNSGTDAYRKKLDEKKAVDRRFDELSASCDEARENLQHWKTYDDAYAVFERYCARRDERSLFLAQTCFNEETLTRFNENQEKDYARLKELRDAYNADLPQLESEAQTRGETLRRLEAARSSIVQYDSRIAELSKRVGLISKTRDNLPTYENALKREKTGLYGELQELGFLAFDAADETRDRTVDLRRARIRDVVFREIAELASDEERLEAEIVDWDAKKKNAQSDVEERTRSETLKRRELIGSFGEEDRSDDVKELEELNENFIGLRKDVEALAEKKGKLDESQRSNADDLTALIVQVCGSEVDDATFKEVARTLGAENVAAPLESELNAIQSEDADLSTRLVASQNESTRLAGEITRLESEIQQLPEDVVSFDMIVERRRKRGLLWRAFKDDFFSGKICDPSTFETLESLTLEIDTLADRRYEHAELSGKLEERRRKLDGVRDQKKKVDSNANELQESCESLRRRAGEQWRRVGLERCAALPVSAAREWLGAWKKWRDDRAAILRDETAFDKLSEDVEKRLRLSFEIASRWVETSAESPDFDMLDEAVRLAETTLKSAKKRLAEYREIVGAVEAQHRELKDAERKIAEYERKLMQKNEERGALRARLDRFCQCRGYEYDAGTKRPCGELNATLIKLSAWQKRFDSYDERCEDFQEERRDVEEFDARVAELKNELQDPLVYERVEDYVASWESRLKEALDIENKWKIAQKSYDDKRNELETKRRTKERYDGQLAEIAAKFGVSREEFDAFRKDATTNRELNENLARESNVFRTKLGVETDEEFKRRCGEFATIDPDVIKQNILRFEVEVANFGRERDDCSAQKGRLAGELAELENEGNPAALLSRYQEALSELREAVNVYVPTLFANRALTQALDECGKDKTPQIRDYAREIFKEVTDGRYVDIEEIKPVGRNGRSSRTEKEGFGFLVSERGYGTKTTRQLSTGTCEQLYLALRLAHIRQYCRQSEPLPIWADDVLLSASHERVKNLIGALKNFADEGYQVVLSTCQLSTRRAFEKIVGEEFVTVLKPRKIKK